MQLCQFRVQSGIQAWNPKLLDLFMVISKMSGRTRVAVNSGSRLVVETQPIKQAGAANAALGRIKEAHCGTAAHGRLFPQWHRMPIPSNRKKRIIGLRLLLE